MKRPTVNAWAAGATAIATLCWASSGYAACKLEPVVAYPVTLERGGAFVEAHVDGKATKLRLSLVGSTFLWRSSADKLGVKYLATQGTANGPGGKAPAVLAHLQSLAAGNAVIKDVNIWVIDDNQEHEEAGSMGPVFFGQNDVDLDFAHRVVRVFKPLGCEGEQVVYWGGSYSVVPIQGADWFYLSLNGQKMAGYLRPDNQVSVITTDGAAQAGVDLQAGGTLPMGMLAGLILRPMDVSVAKFSELTIGDESMKNISLAVGDLHDQKYNWLYLGVDFIKSHHIYLSRSQKKMYFSYIGGNAFQDIYDMLGISPPMVAAIAPAIPASPKP